MALDNASEPSDNRSVRRGPIEMRLILAKYQGDIPHRLLNTMDDDDDAFLASVQNLRSGGTGTWYEGERQRAEVEEAEDAGL